ncbi:MAG: translation elongation factor 4 [Actinomycetota bacterium]
MTDPQYIRNICTVAHIDHGKSTLADRMLEVTGVLAPGRHAAQYLDRMDLERERGITIKAAAVLMPYTRASGETFAFNLIDTPGHVDFSYEVSRALTACEGAILLVDATQGVEAQTVANLYLAIESGLDIIPVINKIDLPASDPRRAEEEIRHLLGDADEILQLSAKTGEGVPELLEAIIERVRPPAVDTGDSSLRALIFDSMFDSYRGVITYVRTYSGEIFDRAEIKLMSTGHTTLITELGVLSPEPTPVERLGPGEVGYLITGIKEVRHARVGDTVTLAAAPAPDPVPGFREPKPMVWTGLYPDEGEYEELRDALDKLRLNDAGFVYEPEASKALGFGFRCGFLGMLHMEITTERLLREFNLELVVTAPTVEFRVRLTNGEELTIHSPADFPDPSLIETIEEPIVDAMLITPTEYVGVVMDICREKRGTQKKLEYLSPERVELTYQLPLGEIIFDFFDQLKSRTRGYASLDYEPVGYHVSDMVRVDMLVHGQSVDAFSTVVHRDRAYNWGRAMAERLQQLIPRQMFDVAIQAAIGAKIIARETVKARRKDVTAKCYGGDVTRKRKLLEKQKKGKTKMRQLGEVEVPPDVFIKALRVEEK